MKIPQVVPLLITLTMTVSFAQKNISAQSINNMIEKPSVVYDTVHRVISDSITLSALESSQAFYNSAFNNILALYSVFFGILALGVAIAGIYVGSGYRKNKKREEELHSLLNEQQNKLNTFKNDMEKELKIANDTTIELKKQLNDFSGKEVKFQKNFDASFRLLSRIYRRTAEDHFSGKIGNKVDNFHEYFYYTHIYYKCILKINELNQYDADRLRRTSDFVSKMSKKEEIQLKDRKNVCWCITSILEFISYCHDNKKNPEALAAANDMCRHLLTFKYKGIDLINNLKESMKMDDFKEETIEKFLSLASNLDVKDNDNPL